MPIVEPFRGASVSSGALRLVSAATGSYRVSYTPLVRGTYDIDIKLPQIDETQTISVTSTDSDFAGGHFQLVNQGTGVTSAKIDVAADGTAVQGALNNIGIADVTVGDRIQISEDPVYSHQWVVTFTAGTGDEPLLGADGTFLTGDAAQVSVVETLRGRAEVAISGSPSTVKVDPAQTSAAKSTAYGPGLVFGEAGQVSRFTIQAKDAYGNDREETQGRSSSSSMRTFRSWSPLSARRTQGPSHTLSTEHTRWSTRRRLLAATRS